MNIASLLNIKAVEKFLKYLREMMHEYIENQFKGEYAYEPVVLAKAGIITLQLNTPFLDGDEVVIEDESLEHAVKLPLDKPFKSAIALAKLENDNTAHDLLQWAKWMKKMAAHIEREMETVSSERKENPDN